LFLLIQVICLASLKLPFHVSTPDFVFFFPLEFVVCWQIAVIKSDSQLSRIHLDKMMAVVKTTVVWGKCKMLMKSHILNFET
jgi:hypothetical protein